MDFLKILCLDSQKQKTEFHNYSIRLFDSVISILQPKNQST